MLCYQMQCKTANLGIFSTPGDFFHNQNCCESGIGTDCSASITGKQLGAIVHIREKVPNIIEMHCMIHHKSLGTIII